MDTTHHDEIPGESIEIIQELLVWLLEIMKCDKKTDAAKYRQLLQKLPNGFEFEYHRLLQYGAFYIIGMHFAKRGREGKNFDKLFRFLIF